VQYRNRAQGGVQYGIRAQGGVQGGVQYGNMEYGIGLKGECNIEKGSRGSAI
jgi:hypothetical protein